MEKIKINREKALLKYETKELKKDNFILLQIEQYRSMNLCAFEKEKEDQTQQ